MMVVDDMAMCAALVIRGPPAWQRIDPGVAKKQFQTIIVGTQVQLETDQPRGNRVKHFAEDKAAGRGHPHTCRIIIATPPFWQRLEIGAFKGHLLPALCIVAANDLSDEAPPCLHSLEVRTAAQKQRLFQTRLEVSMAAFDGAVLVGDAAIVSGRFHAIIGTQRLVPRPQILINILLPVAKGS